MADYRGYVTAAGQQFEALAKQMHYPVKIGFIEIGDGTLPDNESPISRTSLVHKTKQFPAIVEQDPDRPGEWIAKCHIPADDAINGQGYFIREMGCKLVDQGDGVLYAYRRISNDWKPLITEGEAKSFIYILRFIPSNGELIKPTINPSVVYVDKQEQERRFREHAAEEAPHSQYAKKANVPVALDNLQKIAAALGNNPNYAAYIAVELLGKLDKKKNGSDIPDKNAFIANLELKSAALKDVGNGSDQIPDMSYYSSLTSAGLASGWRKTPDRFIEQWVSVETVASPAVQKIDVNLPIPFPNKILSVGTPLFSTDEPSQRFAGVSLPASSNSKISIRVVTPTVNTVYLRVLGI